MSEIVLVHGSCHGAWCWRDVVPVLEGLGHDVTAIDLPSHGCDPTPAKAVTLDLYAHAVLHAIKRKAILVGHSAGGYPITLAAEIAPQRVDQLVYLCAYVPASYKTLADLRRSAPRQPLLDAVIVDESRTTFTVDPEKAIEKFFGDVEPETAKWAASMLGPQPIEPQETIVRLDRSLKLKRSYIRCLHDGAIPTEFQFTMTEDWPDERVADMPTSHSPFLSDPVGLAHLIHKLTRD